jgi:hypothetical protein
MKMIANPSPKPSLDDVLAEIAADPSPPDARSLRVWTAKYPEFAVEIVDFATDWIEMDAARSEHVVTVEDVDLVVNRTMSRVQAMLDAAERPEVLTDLATDIRAAGHDLDTFQRAVGIDRSILDCLIARLVSPVRLPASLVRALAETLNRSLDAVRGYLRLPPQQVAAYKSRRRPDVKQADFAEIVRHSQLSEAEKAHWLAEPPDPGLGE